MEIKPEVLINAVYSRPVIWDQTCKMHHNRVIVEKFWISISKEMKIPKELLKRKWKYLRDQFRVEMKKLLTAKSGDGPLEYGSTWIYFKSLLFLKDQIRCRPSTGNLKAFVPSDEEEDNSNDVADETLNLYPEVEFENFEMSLQPSLKKVKKGADDNAEIIDIENRKLELFEKKVTKREEWDEDVAFFYSLLPHVQKLEPAQKLLCRMEIQNIVYKHVYNTNFQLQSSAPIPSTSRSTSISSVASPLSEISQHVSSAPIPPKSRSTSASSVASPHFENVNMAESAAVTKTLTELKSIHFTDF